MNPFRSVVLALVVASAAVIGVSGCGGGSAAEGEARVLSLLTDRPRDPALRIARSLQQVSGTLVDDGIIATFSSEQGPRDQFSVKVQINDLWLTAEYADGAEQLDGWSSAEPQPALMTDGHLDAIRRLLSALELELHPPLEGVTDKREYDAVRRLTPAEARLFRVIDSQWSRWPATLPLTQRVGGQGLLSYTSWRRYASTSTTVTGCHDCNVCSFSGDCCDSGKKLGEYWNAVNYGNCGTSSTGSQFTQDCTNHDQCVRTTRHGGHVLVSAYCDDQFAACIDDAAFAPECDYDWRGSPRKGSCPTAWNGDGACDCFCQFQDSDC